MMREQKGFSMNPWYMAHTFDYTIEFSKYNIVSDNLKASSLKCCSEING